VNEIRTRSKGRTVDQDESTDTNSDTDTATAEDGHGDITNADFNDAWRRLSNIDLTDNDESCETDFWQINEDFVKAQMQDRSLNSLRVRAQRGSSEFVVKSGILFRRDMNAHSSNEF